MPRSAKPKRRIRAGRVGGSRIGLLLDGTVRHSSVFVYACAKAAVADAKNADGRIAENRAAGAGFGSATGKGKICKGRGAIKRPDVLTETAKAAGKDMQRKRGGVGE